MNKKINWKYLGISIIRGYLFFIGGGIIFIFFLLLLHYISLPKEITLVIGFLIFGGALFVGGMIDTLHMPEENFFHKWLYSVSITVLIFFSSSIRKLKGKEIFVILFLSMCFFASLIGGIIGERYKKRMSKK